MLVGICQAIRQRNFIKRIDAADMVYSDTKDPYFRDCFIKGM
jgi:hypothetical protein